MVKNKYSFDYMTMDSVDEEKSSGNAGHGQPRGRRHIRIRHSRERHPGDKYWLAKRIAKDIDNCGTKDARIQVKTDQEQAIVNLQEEVGELRRGKTICTNSPVGE